MARHRRMLGSVDLLGLNNFGQNPGMSPLIGTAIGGGVSGVTTLALRQYGSAHPELYGLGIGLATAGAMYAMKSTRHASLGAALGAGLASGLALLAKHLFGHVTVATAPAASAGGTAGMGIPSVRALNGFGIPAVRALNGLGLPTVSPTPTPAGTIPGVAGNQLATPGLSSPPVSLLGPMSPQAAHLRGVGGPMVHGLSAAYGATLLGGGR
jgi:hypothetical protein